MALAIPGKNMVVMNRSAKITRNVDLPRLMLLTSLLLQGRRSLEAYAPDLRTMAANTTLFTSPWLCR